MPRSRESRSASHGRPVHELPGVGPRRAERLARAGLVSLGDLLGYLPCALRREGPRVALERVEEHLGREVSLSGRLVSPRIFRRGGRRCVVRADLVDGDQRVRALFFNQPWLFGELKQRGDEAVELRGRVVRTKQGLALAAPRIGREARPLPPPGSVEPVYPPIEGIGAGLLRGWILAALEEVEEPPDDPLAHSERASLGLPALGEALTALHRPTGEAAFHAARRRLALEGILCAQADFARLRRARARARAPRVVLAEAARDALLASLPHRPTGDQRAALGDVLADLERGAPMRRLLQGDVGAGKTLVAQATLGAALVAGGQAAFLAPTELLAAQHHRSLGPWLEARGARAALLVGSQAAAERRRTASALARGSLRVVIGTHALLAADVGFRRLDLVVLDEQQRFGVEQKQRLLEKGRAVHLLLMTATPIPRTLALALHGDLDVSQLRERPPGRGRLATHVVARAKRGRMIRFLGERMAAGDRVFWVCPRIEGELPGSAAQAEEAGAVASAEAVATELRRGPLARHGIELVHGRLEPEEREARLDRFRAGAARLLVGTTVVEVGVDVPEATVMVIEGAERFGLAQLHQLRGRVGRGPKPAWCFLLGTEGARARLALLEGTNDGFRIAEEDLRRRGMGDLAGVRQSGRGFANPDGLVLDEEAGDLEPLGDPLADTDLVLLARRLLEERPALLERYGGRRAPGLPGLV